MASPRPRLPPPPRAVAPFLNGRIIRASHRLRRRGEETPVFEKDGVKFIVGNLSYDFVKGATVDYTEELIQSAFLAAMMAAESPMMAGRKHGFCRAQQNFHRGKHPVFFLKKWLIDET
uniref:Uncharacterized protein n=1 Tax=Oryza punctata TaxID=4537 RepID=A0A0E0LZR8_ORYPU